MIKTKKNAGVSPVIGIILMVAVTVALVALAATIVFDLGSDVSEPADATIDIDQDSDGNVEAEVVRNENVEEFVLTSNADGGSSADILDEDVEAETDEYDGHFDDGVEDDRLGDGVGDTMNIDEEDGDIEGDSVSVLADVNGDGEPDETLQSEDIEPTDD